MPAYQHIRQDVSAEVERISWLEQSALSPSFDTELAVWAQHADPTWQTPMKQLLPQTLLFALLYLMTSKQGRVSHPHWQLRPGGSLPQELALHTSAH